MQLKKVLLNKPTINRISLPYTSILADLQYDHKNIYLQSSDKSLG